MKTKQGDRRGSNRNEGAKNWRYWRHQRCCEIERNVDGWTSQDISEISTFSTKIKSSENLRHAADGQALSNGNTATNLKDMVHGAVVYIHIWRIKKRLSLLLGQPPSGRARKQYSRELSCKPTQGMLRPTREFAKPEQHESRHATV